MVARFIGLEARPPFGSSALVTRPPCRPGHRRRAWTAKRARAAAHRLVEEAPCWLTSQRATALSITRRQPTPRGIYLFRSLTAAVGLGRMLERAVAGGATFNLFRLGFFGSRPLRF